VIKVKWLVLTQHYAIIGMQSSTHQKLHHYMYMTRLHATVALSTGHVKYMQCGLTAGLGDVRKRKIYPSCESNRDFPVIQLVPCPLNWPS
jgi:hypothetical protein